MNPTTLSALQASIQHWEHMAKHGYGISHRAHRSLPLPDQEVQSDVPSSNACALCSLFLKRDCDGCPVAEADHYYCRATPYGLAYEAWEDGNMPAFKAAAADEVAFLQGLLPKEVPA